MKLLRILDRQLMQPEGVTHLSQLVGPRLEQSQPHEAILAAAGGRLLQRHRAFLLPAAVLVMSAIDDHLGPFSGQAAVSHP
jgi:hypothetical protein